MEGRKDGGFKKVAELNLRPGVEFVNFAKDILQKRAKYTWQVGAKFEKAKTAEEALLTALKNIQLLMEDTEKSRAPYKASQSLQEALDAAEAAQRKAEKNLNDIYSGEHKKKYEADAKALNKQVLLKRQDSKVKLNKERKELLEKIKIEQDKLMAAKEAKIMAEQAHSRPRFLTLRKKATSKSNESADVLAKEIQVHEAEIAKLTAQLEGTDYDKELDKLEKDYETATTIAENYEDKKSQFIEEANAELALAKSSIEKCHNAIDAAEEEYYCDINARCMHGIVSLYEAFVAYSNEFSKVGRKKALEENFAGCLAETKKDLDQCLAKLRCNELRDKMTAKEVLDLVRALSPQEQVHILTQKPDGKLLANLLKPVAPSIEPVTAASVLTSNLFKRTSTLAGAGNPLLNSNLPNSNNTNNPSPRGPGGH